MSEVAGEAFGLVEFPLPLFKRMQRHRDNQVPLLARQRGSRLTCQQISQKRLEPHRSVVFIRSDDLQDHPVRDQGRPGETKTELHSLAILADKRMRYAAIVRQPASFAEWRS